MIKKSLLVSVLLNPDSIRQYSLSDWDLLLRQAYCADITATLWRTLDNAGLSTTVPKVAMVHFESAQFLAESHVSETAWEVSRVAKALNSVGLSVILLKGAAYQLIGLPMADGRIFSDIDLLVPHANLQSAERALLLNGWVSTHLDKYDQRYYRQWMHELPPLKHFKRKSVLDLHHTILPLTAKSKPNSSKLFADIIPVPGHPDIYTLSPIDMTLHSATHLFHEGEFEHGFRGLLDLDGLLRHFSAEIDDFWATLIARAAELDLKKPLYYALRYTQAILETPVPADAIEKIGDGVPKGLSAMFMDALFMRALQPYHHSCDRFGSGLARWMLFVRSHYLKMPMNLLIPHLFRKSMKPKKYL